MIWKKYLMRKTILYFLILQISIPLLSVNAKDLVVVIILKQNTRGIYCAPYINGIDINILKYRLGKLFNSVYFYILQENNTLEEVEKKINQYRNSPEILNIEECLRLIYKKHKNTSAVFLADKFIDINNCLLIYNLVKCDYSGKHILEEGSRKRYDFDRVFNNIYKEIKSNNICELITQSYPMAIFGYDIDETECEKILKCIVARKENVVFITKSWRNDFLEIEKTSEIKNVKSYNEKTRIEYRIQLLMKIVNEQWGFYINEKKEDDIFKLSIKNSEMEKYTNGIIVKRQKKKINSKLAEINILARIDILGKVDEITLTLALILREGIIKRDLKLNEENDEWLAEVIRNNYCNIQCILQESNPEIIKEIIL